METYKYNIILLILNIIIIYIGLYASLVSLGYNRTNFNPYKKHLFLSIGSVVTGVLVTLLELVV